MRKNLFIFMLLTALTIQAKQTYYVYKNDNSWQKIEVASTQDISFSSDSKTVFFTLSDQTTCSFAVADLDSIAFTQPNGGTSLVYSANFDVAFDSSDETSYSEVPETITAVETETNDYNDFVEHYSVSSTITITYNGATASYSGTASNVAVAINGANVTVTSAKKKVKYVLKGTTTNGSFKVYSDYKFQVELGGVNITNPTGPAINIQSGKTVYITLAAGTTNTLCDGSSYAAATVKNGVTEDQKGAFFSEGQLMFSGTGTLNVTSNYGHGICCDDYIRVRGGVINVLGSVKDGINTNDHFIMGGGTLTINASNDGIDCGKGHIILNAGKIFITSMDDGITASYDSTDITITPYISFNGGFVKITTTHEKGMAIKSTGNFTMSGGIAQLTANGDGSKGVSCDKNFLMSAGKITAITSGSVNSEGTSAAGIKCEGSFTLTDGTIAAKSTGNGAKGINSTGDITIQNGKLTVIASGNDHSSATEETKSRGMASEGSIVFTNGTVTASSVAGHAISATQNITVNGGFIQGFTGHKVPAISAGNAFTQNGGWMVDGLK